MKNRIMVALTVGLLSGMVAFGWTKDSAPSVSTKTFISLDSADRSIEGTVIKVDIHEASLKIKDPLGQEKIVTVDQETQILRDGVPIQLAKLRTGDSVLIYNPQLILIPNTPSSAAD